jgi:hypothetical protein
MSAYALFSDSARDAALAAIGEPIMCEDEVGLWRQIVKAVCAGNVAAKIGGTLGTQDTDYQKQTFVAFGNP